MSTANLESSADLMLKAAAVLSLWDQHYDPTREENTARELYIRALSLRVLLETEKREKVLH